MYYILCNPLVSRIHDHCWLINIRARSHVSFSESQSDCQVSTSRSVYSGLISGSKTFATRVRSRVAAAPLNALLMENLEVGARVVGGKKRRGDGCRGGSRWWEWSHTPSIHHHPPPSMVDPCPVFRTKKVQKWRIQFQYIEPQLEYFSLQKWSPVHILMKIVFGLY